MRKSKPAPPLHTVWDLWEHHGLEYRNWRERVEALVAVEWWQTAEWKEWDRVFDRLFATLLPHAGDAGGELDARLVQLVTDAVYFSAAVGYCLGRTAPTGLDQMDAWAERARAMYADSLTTAPRKSPVWNDEGEQERARP